MTVSPDVVTRTAKVLNREVGHVAYYANREPVYAVYNARTLAQELADAGLLRTETDERNAAIVAKLTFEHRVSLGTTTVECLYVASPSDAVASAGETPTTPHTPAAER